LYIYTTFTAPGTYKDLYCTLTGKVFVRDTRSDSRYIAYVNGNLEFKVLGINVTKLQQLESHIQGNEAAFVRNILQAPEYNDTSTSFGKLLSFTN